MLKMKSKTGIIMIQPLNFIFFPLSEHETLAEEIIPNQTD